MLAAEEKAAGRVGRLRSLVGSSRDGSGDDLTQSAPTPFAVGPWEEAEEGGLRGGARGSAAEAASIPVPLSARRRGGGGGGSGGSLTTASASSLTALSSSGSAFSGPSLRPSAPQRPPPSARPRSARSRDHTGLSAPSGVS
jgi:hypothetical protein